MLSHKQHHNIGAWNSGTNSVAGLTENSRNKPARIAINICFNYNKVYNALLMSLDRACWRIRIQDCNRAHRHDVNMNERSIAGPHIRDACQARSHCGVSCLRTGWPEIAGFIRAPVPVQRRHAIRSRIFVLL
jgi:hypothetical protein